jgi:hypothetical protein
MNPANRKKASGRRTGCDGQALLIDATSRHRGKQKPSPDASPSIPELIPSGDFSSIPELLSPDRLAYSIAELSAATSISRSVLYEHAKGGEATLRFTKVGRRTVVLREDAEAWLRALRQQNQRMGAEAFGKLHEGPDENRRNS